MNFVCTVFEQGDEMLTLLSMEKQMVECKHLDIESSLAGVILRFRHGHY